MSVARGRAVRLPHCRTPVPAPVRRLGHSASPRKSIDWWTTAHRQISVWKRSRQRNESAFGPLLWNSGSVSFDVFFQGFVAVESSSRGAGEMVAVLAPYVTARDGSFRRVAIGDGAADVYLNDDGLMAN